jgi:F0F1-type ATP synthase delta subunit
MTRNKFHHKVVDAYDVLMQAGRGVVTAVVISSEPLKKKSIDTVRAAILKMTGSNAQVH